jgi:hypothetical protein
MLKVFDSKTKLRSVQHVNLPANYRISTCEQYLILLS